MDQFSILIGFTNGIIAQYNSLKNTLTRTFNFDPKTKGSYLKLIVKQFVQIPSENEFEVLVLLNKNIII